MSENFGCPSGTYPTCLYVVHFRAHGGGKRCSFARTTSSDVGCNLLGLVPRSRCSSSVARDNAVETGGARSFGVGSASRGSVSVGQDNGVETGGTYSFGLGSARPRDSCIPPNDPPGRLIVGDRPLCASETSVRMNRMP